MATIAIITVSITTRITACSKPSLNLIVYLLLFLGSATVGLWAAYDYEQALTKYLILIVAALLAILLSQLDHQGSIVHVYLGTGALLFSIAFLGILLFDINQGELLTPNRLAGLIGILTPFLVLTYIQSESKLLQYLSLGAGLIVILALLLSGSRGGIAALLVGLAFWKILTVQRIIGRKSKLIIGSTLFSLTMLGTVSLFFSQQLSTSIFSFIPSSTSRLTLYTNLQYLLTDYWLLGGGLNSFSGHYSQYVLSIPFLRFTYGHHLYLDLILEQGIIGISSFCILVVSSLIFLLTDGLDADQDRKKQHFTGAILASLTTLILHGFIDNAIYSNAGSTMLFIGPALAFSLAKTQQTNRLIKRLNLVVLSAFIIIGISLNTKLISTWHANAGSIEMAKIQLAEWPTGEWSRGESTEALQKVIPTFETALEQNRQNTSAHFRLGLIALDRHDFPAAAVHLAEAQKTNQSHIGIQKNLGYAYLWSSDFDKAKTQLQSLENIQNELDAYRWWWQELNRPDLSDIARDAHQTGITSNNE
ncbi:MAG: O-antigen ligase family protein [Anaerolineae bacterium]